MTALMGINCGYPFESVPSEMAIARPRLVRTVYRRTNDYTLWLEQLGYYGIKPWFVMDGSSESLGTDGSQWDANMAEAEGRVGYACEIWQVMNEPDWNGAASWPLPKNIVNEGLDMARYHFPRERGYKLIAPGLVSGDPNYPEGLRLDRCDGLDVHPYNKFVSSEAEEYELAYMLTLYRDYWGLPLYIGEFDSRTDNLPVYFRDFPGVAAACTFCWSSGQTSGEGIFNMGLRENKWAFDNFVESTGGAFVPLPPAPEEPIFEQGFAKWAALEPSLVGRPRRRQRGVGPGWVTIPTTKGAMSWVDGQGHLFVTNKGKIFRWQEHWAKSQEVL